MSSNLLGPKIYKLLVSFILMIFRFANNICKDNPPYWDRIHDREPFIKDFQIKWSGYIPISNFGLPRPALLK
jgi:hypothetical protein